MAWHVCTVPDCPNLTESGRCPDCRREAEARRGNATQRGYTGRGHQVFRIKVLRRDPACVLCGAPSTEADHWPVDRRTLVLRGENPNHPRHGRGLCKPCHAAETAARQPGGWHAHQ